MTLEEKLAKIAQENSEQLAIKIRRLEIIRTIATPLFAIMIGMGFSSLVMKELDVAILGSGISSLTITAQREFYANFEFMWVLLLVALAIAIISIIRQRSAAVFKKGMFWYLATPYPTAKLLVFLHSFLSMKTMLLIERSIFIMAVCILLLVVIFDVVIIVAGMKILSKLSEL